MVLLRELGSRKEGSCKTVTHTAPSCTRHKRALGPTRNAQNGALSLRPPGSRVQHGRTKGEQAEGWYQQAPLKISPLCQDQGQASSSDDSGEKQFVDLRTEERDERGKRRRRGSYVLSCPARGPSHQRSRPQKRRSRHRRFVGCCPGVR